MIASGLPAPPELVKVISYKYKAAGKAFHKEIAAAFHQDHPAQCSATVKDQQRSANHEKK